MVKYLKVLLSSVLLLSFCLVLPGLIYAQSSLGPGVDLIVLIDQSNSMFGLGATEERDAIPGTDREGRRIDTAQYLIDYMAFDNVYVNPNRTNRVLVIAFGSYGRDKVVVPLTNLTSEQASQKAKDLLEPLRSSRESLNGTDFISAFEEISEHFSASAGDAVDPDANGLRNRLVVVITDGGPDIRGTRFDSNEEYFRYLGETYHVMLGEDYPVYVIGVDQSEPPLYWNEVVDLWEDNVTGAGNAVQVSDPREIKKQVVQMFCPFLNPTSTGEECRLQDIGDHFILPYARSLSFSFFKYDPDAKIELYRPTLSGETGGEGVQVSPTRDPDVLEYNKTRSDEFFGLENPHPGCWRSEREGAGKVDVLLQIVFNDLLMTQPSSIHPLGSPLDFEFSLRDNTGNPIDELGDFPIDLEAELIAPDGSSQTLLMEKAQPGLYVSKQPALTALAGSYQLVLAGSTTVPPIQDCLPSGGTYAIFSQTFQIPVNEPKVSIVEPDGTYLPYRPLERLSVQFTDKLGSSIHLDSRLTPSVSVEGPKGEGVQLNDVSIDDDMVWVDEKLLFPQEVCHSEYELNI